MRRGLGRAALGSRDARFGGTGGGSAAPFVAPVGGEGLLLTGENSSTSANKDVIQIAGNATNKPTTALSVMAWCRPFSTSGSGFFAADAIVGTNTQSRWRLQREGAQWRGGVSFGGAGSDSYTVITGGVAAVDVWAHVALVYAGSGATMRLYVNGTEVGTTTGPATLLALTSQPIEIGRCNGTGANTTPPSAVRDFRLYNRAVTAQEVSDIYTGAVAVTSGLVCQVTGDGVIADATGVSTTSTIATPSYCTSSLITTSAPAVGAIKVHCIGDSNTQRDDAFRREFRRYLSGYFGRNVDLVGHTSTADITPLALDGDIQHSGVFGQSAAAQKSLVAAWVAAAAPDILVLMQGTNDSNTADSAATIAANIEEEAVNALTAAPGKPLVLVTLYPNSAAYSAKTDAVAALMPTVASNLRALGYTIYEANPRATLSIYDLTDTVHATRAGAVKAARPIARAVAQAMGVIP